MQHHSVITEGNCSLLFYPQIGVRLVCRLSAKHHFPLTSGKFSFSGSRSFSHIGEHRKDCKKHISSLFVIALAAMAFSSCFCLSSMHGMCSQGMGEAC